MEANTPDPLFGGWAEGRGNLLSYAGHKTFETSQTEFLILLTKTLHISYCSLIR